MEQQIVSNVFNNGFEGLAWGRDARVMAQRPTIHDVAATAGVSVATVSKAVNGRYGVASATVARVLKAVQELGYESSLVASSMRSRRTGVIGVLVADFEPFSAEILKGVGAELRESQYDLLAYAGSHQVEGPGWERRSLQRLSGTLIDGAIIVTPTVVSATAEIPIVAIDPHAGRADLPTVESDSFSGARQAVQYLIELGHTRIGFMGGRQDLRSAALREAGYRRALSDAGIRALAAAQSDAAERGLRGERPLGNRRARGRRRAGTRRAGRSLGHRIRRHSRGVADDTADDHDPPAHASPRRHCRPHGRGLDGRRDSRDDPHPASDPPRSARHHGAIAQVNPVL
jgi:hypothetical protein